MSIQDITIVIASFKSEKKIKNCLNSIDKQAKVLVIENSNNSSFKENLEKEFNIKKSSFINKVIYILFIINLYNNNLWKY